MINRLILATALLLAAAFATTSLADGYGGLSYNAAWQNGSYHQGYHWWYGHPYRQYKVKVYACSSGYSCSCSYRCRWYWQNRYAQIAGYDYGSSGGGYGATISADSISNGTWRGKLLSIVERRDIYEAKARASALEHNEFLETIKSLGIEGNFGWDGYGYAPQYAQGFGALFGYQQQPMAYNSQFGAQTGGTQYAYAYASDYADSYRNADIAALISRQQSFQELSEQNTAAAVSATGELIDRKGERDTEVARLRAQAELNERTVEAMGRAYAMGLTAGKPQERTTTQRTTATPYAVQQNSVEVQGESSSAHARAMLKWSIAKNESCVVCHNGQHKSGVDLRSPDGETLGRMREAIESGKMPPQQNPETGEPIPPLSEERRALLLWGTGPGV